MTDIKLLSNVNADSETAIPPQVGERGGVNVYAKFTSLGGGTLNIYECPTSGFKPNVPIYTSETGEPQHLNVAISSWLVGELIGATNPSSVTLGVMTLGDEDCD